MSFLSEFFLRDIWQSVHPLTSQADRHHDQHNHDYDDQHDEYDPDQYDHDGGQAKLGKV